MHTVLGTCVTIHLKVGKGVYAHHHFLYIWKETECDVSSDLIDMQFGNVVQVVYTLTWWT